MKFSPVTILVCILAFNPAAVLSSARSPEYGKLLAPGPAGKLPAYSTRGEAGPELQRVQASPRTPAGISFRDPGCRQGIAGGRQPDNVPAGKQCMETSAAQQRFTLHLGRRVGNRADILGEFDGVRVDYRPVGRISLNGVAGYPVVAQEDEFNTSRQVVGISAVSDRFARNWDMGGYLVDQQENGVVAGRSMGGVIRHLQPGRSFLAYFDHDLAGDAPGTLLLTGAWRLPRDITLSGAFDYSGRPLPQRQQRYLQQTTGVTPGWSRMLSTLALANREGEATGDIGTLAIGLTHTWSPRLELGGDMAIVDVSAAESTGEVLNPEEYHYHLNVAGSDLLFPGGRSSLDLYHRVTAAGTINTASIDSRYPVKGNWNLAPQLRAEYHREAAGHSPRWVASPRLKMEYRQNRQSSFLLEAGGNVFTRDAPAGDQDRAACFVSLGYQANF